MVAGNQTSLEEPFPPIKLVGHKSNRLTSLGIDNTGKLVLTYGQEDVDKDSNGAYIYRAAESNFFCRIRDLFADKLKGMFHSRESLGAWSSADLIKKWDDAQNQFPEELWRLDIERKYIRTYRGVSIDNSIQGAANPMFLEPMLNGRKRYQRRQFDRNQELYFATKYISTFAMDDFIRLRFNNPTNPVVKQDYTLYLTPYSDMYISVAFGNTDPISFRAKAGIEYTVARDTESATADIILIYGASFIQGIGDLSKCYLGDNDFSMASRLQKLVIGSDIAGYENTFMTGLALGNNKLLEYLDIRNITGLEKVIDLSNCHNLIELYAEGSGATGVIFANGGKIVKAHIPAVGSLTMKNLDYIEEFEVDGYNNLQTLIVENSPAINSYSIVNSSNKLNTIRLIGIDWNESYGIQDTAILDRLYVMNGIDANGYILAKQPIVTGNFHAAIVKEKKLADYNDMWQDLDIGYSTLVNQFAVVFKNEDGSILEIQYVDKGSKPVDPTTRVDNPIPIPTKESTVSTNYTYAGWDGTLNVEVFEPLTYTATYSESVREYTIKYVSKNRVEQTTVAPYGSTVVYTGETPTYTAEEIGYKYYLFDSWDKSGFVSGDKTINAIYDVCEYSSGYFDGKELANMQPVEVYAMTQLGLASKYLTNGDTMTIELGNDFSYEDVDEKVLISEPVNFGGSNYIETEECLFAEDKNFVLAIDYSMSGTNVNNNVLAQCFSASNRSGFRLWYNGGVKVSCGSTVSDSFVSDARDMLVIRHVKGEKGIHVYASNARGSESYYVKLEGAQPISYSGPLIFGCSKPDESSYEDYGIGTVYWSKIWYTDLGEDVCKQLAYWPHEKIDFQMCGTTRYFLSDNADKRCSLSLIASNPLSNTMQLNSATTASTTGGWAKMTLNSYLNSRIYKAFPHKWKQLMKKVKIWSTNGNKSSEVSSSDCYVTIPSVFELSEDFNKSPYYNEGSRINLFTTNPTRILYDENGNAVSYWTRSPNVDNTNYIYIVTVNGEVNGFNYPNKTHHVRIIISM